MSGASRSASDRVAGVAARFDGSRLTLARQLAGLRKSQLAELVGRTPTAVAGWENGTKQPTPANVAQLALSLEVDAEFFAIRSASVAEEVAPPHFRSLRATTQLARDQAFAYGRLALAVSDSLERLVELPEVELPSIPVEPDADGDAPAAAARAVRQAWGIPDGPIRHVLRLVENHGVLVVFSPPQAASVDAYSFVGVERPLIVLNPIKNDYYRQRFDVAHELGHLVMHGDTEPGSRVAESQAHRFAAEFLAPTAELRGLLPQVMNRRAWATLAQLKEDWGVSIQALLYRARELGRLSEVSYRNAMGTITARGWRRNEPGAISTIEQPSLLAKATEILTQEGYDSSDLADEGGAPGRLFNMLTSRRPELVAAHGATYDRGAEVVSLFGAREQPR